MSSASCARGSSNELSPHLLAYPAITLKLLVCSGILDNLALIFFPKEKTNRDPTYGFGFGFVF